MKLSIVKEKSCKICCSNVKYLNRHLKLQHSNFDEKQYYDTFLKKPNEEYCKTCGKELKFKSLYIGYGSFCNSTCEMNNKEFQNRLKINYKDNTGFDHNFKNPISKNKIKNTQTRKYGGIGFASDEIKNKALENYNKKHNTNIKDFSELSHTKESDQNRKKSRLERHNGKYFEQSVHEKIVKASITPEAIKTRIENRWKNNPNYYSDEYFKRLQEKSLKTYSWANMKLFKSNNKGNCICHCDLCNNDYEINLLSLRTRKSHNKVLCTICNPLYSESVNNFTTSKQEKDLLNEVKKLYNGTIIENDRNVLEAKELDIYLPDLKIGIEYNGDYWHANPLYYKENDVVCEGKLAKDIWKNDEYKHNLCVEKGIKLITVFETEWIQTRNLVLNKIKNVINNI